METTALIDPDLKANERSDSIKRLVSYLSGLESTETLGEVGLDSSAPKSEKTIGLTATNKQATESQSIPLLIVLDNPHEQSVPLLKNSNSQILSPYFPDEWAAITGIDINPSIRSRWHWLPPIIPIETPFQGNRRLFISHRKHSVLARELKHLFHERNASPTEDRNSDVLELDDADLAAGVEGELEMEAAALAQGATPLFLYLPQGNPMRKFARNYGVQPRITQNQLRLRDLGRACLDVLTNDQSEKDAERYNPKSIWERLCRRILKSANTPDQISNTIEELLEDPKQRERPPPGWAHNWPASSTNWTQQVTPRVKGFLNDWFQIPSNFDRYHQFLNELGKLSTTPDFPAKRKQQVVTQALRDLANWMLTLNATPQWASHFTELQNRFPNWSEICEAEIATIYNQNPKAIDAYSLLAYGIWSHGTSMKGLALESSKRLATQCDQLYLKDRKSGRSTWPVYFHSLIPRCWIADQEQIEEQIEQEFKELGKARGGFTRAATEMNKAGKTIPLERWQERDRETGGINTEASLKALDWLCEEKQWETAEQFCRTTYQRHDSEGYLTRLVSLRLEPKCWSFFLPECAQKNKTEIQKCLNLLEDEITLGKAIERTFALHFRLRSFEALAKNEDIPESPSLESPLLILFQATDLFHLRQFERAAACMCSIANAKPASSTELAQKASIALALGLDAIALPALNELKKTYPSLCREGSQLNCYNQYLYLAIACHCRHQTEIATRFERAAAERDPDYPWKAKLASQEMLPLLDHPCAQIPEFDLN